MTDLVNRAKNKRTQITIVYIENGNEREADIEVPLNTRIRELKTQIERMYNLRSGTLSNKQLRLKQNRDRTTSYLEDNKTLFDYRVQTGAKINFTILENRGGKNFFLIK